MTVSTLRVNAPRGSHSLKPGLLPTPIGFPVYLPPPPPSEPTQLERRGVVCVDRQQVVEGEKKISIPAVIRVGTCLVRGSLKNSFIDFSIADSDDELLVSRRSSCPDVWEGSGGCDVETPRMVAPKRRSVATPGITTYMIRNIPTRFTSVTFVRLLEDYGFGDTFNFFYLPMDFRSGKNMGYAFINFYDPEVGVRFVSKFHSRRLPVSTSKKVIEISPSRRQGLIDNIALFRTSDLLNSVSLPHYKPLIATEQTGGALVPLSEHNFPQV